MSIEAVSAVFGAKIGDQVSKLVLLALANHAHKDGTASFPSKATIAEVAECDPKTVQRHLRRLEARGWIRRGDQQLVAHYRADRRPVVYDLGLEEAVREVWAAEHRHGGAEDPPVPRTAESTPVDNSTRRGDGVSPRVEGHGGTQETQRGDAAVSPKPSRTIQSPPSPAASGRGGRCPAHPDGRANCRMCGTTPRQLAEAARKADDDQRRAAARDLALRQRQEAEERARAADPEATRAAQAAARSAVVEARAAKASR